MINDQLIMQVSEPLKIVSMQQLYMGTHPRSHALVCTWDTTHLDIFVLYETLEKFP